MTPANWQRVRDLFERVVEEQPADLDAWLAREAGDSPDVRDEVRSLVDHHSRAGTFLMEAPAERFASLLDDEPLAAGHVIGPYTIVRELGRGGMGRVYLATDSRLGRSVALKAVAPRLTGDPANRERLRREARAAAGLSHPGICTVYALEEYEGDLFIAAEYVDGQTLRQELLSAPRPAPAEILRTARDVAAALASAHARGIVHRDLKPENVMRTGDGRVKILDFGLARADAPDDDPRAIRVTQAGMMVGTPGYMAPEQLSGERGDARADVFAYGVLIYELACGAHPFASSTALGVAARILHSDATPIDALCPALPAPLAAVVDRCLRKSPAERFGSAAEIASALAWSGPGADRSPVSWWRAHQGIVIGLYFLASVFAWMIKEWAGSLAVAVFGVVGVAAIIGGILRGHLLFTEQVNARGLVAERRLTERATFLVDAVIAVALLVDGALLSTHRPLAAVLIAGLGVGIVLARLVLERSTSAAAFDR
jgi:Protein kinase domain